MGKYCMRPVVVEAEQWFPDRPIEGVERVVLEGSEELRGFLKTVEGFFLLEAGDWILTGEDNIERGCSRENFDRIYEEVEG